MSLPTLLLIALGLSLDAFAVAVASGCSFARLKFGHALRMAAAFGLFQAVMPIIGWLAGVGPRSLISEVDHWIAFGLLTAIGAKMIYEATRLREEERSSHPFSPPTLLILSVATSVDALAVGLSLSFLKVQIIAPAGIIGAIAFALSLAGVYIGKRFGHLFESKIEIAGGMILIGIGAKILIEHLRAP